MQESNKIRRVEITFEDGRYLQISGDEIERLNHAAEALELVNRAKEAAKRWAALGQP